MIISKTPFRISFVGGGTDLKEYYSEGYGAVFSAAIDKYMYITVNKRFDNTIRVSYSKTEIVPAADDVKHPIVRAVLKYLKINRGVEITSVADIPAGTGLGSSGSFTVGLLNALYAYKGIYKSPAELAKEASYIEIDVLGEPIGKQDQYAAAFGGVNYIRFNSDESVFVKPLICDKRKLEKFKKHLILFYTGIKRRSSSVLSEQKRKTKDNTGHLDIIRDYAWNMYNIVSEGGNIREIGAIFDESWCCKKKLANGISNPEIEKWYDTAVKNGAFGGKLLGAGGGGFLLFFAPLKYRNRIKKFLKLREFEFSFSPEGSKIIYYER